MPGASHEIAYLLTTSGIRPVLEKKIADGLSVLGTCAGLILLATRSWTDEAISGA